MYMEVAATITRIFLNGVRMQRTGALGDSMRRRFAVLAEDLVTVLSMCLTAHAATRPLRRIAQLCFQVRIQGSGQ